MEAVDTIINPQKVDPVQIKGRIEDRKRDLIRQKKWHEEVVPGDLRVAKPKKFVDIIAQVKRDTKALDTDVLNELLGTKGQLGVDEFKFVRAGNKIFITSYGNLHLDMAIAKGVIPEDGGFIKRKPGTAELEIYGGSMGLEIEEDNENRQATLKTLQGLDPSIKFVQAKATQVNPFPTHIQR